MTMKLDNNEKKVILTTKLLPLLFSESFDSTDENLLSQLIQFLEEELVPTLKSRFGMRDLTEKETTELNKYRNNPEEGELYKHDLFFNKNVTIVVSLNDSWSEDYIQLHVYLGRGYEWSHNFFKEQTIYEQADSVLSSLISFIMEKIPVIEEFYSSEY